MSTKNKDSFGIESFFSDLRVTKPVERRMPLRERNPFIALFELYDKIDDSEISEHVCELMRFFDNVDLARGVKYVLASHLTVEQIISICSFFVRFPKNDHVKMAAGFLTSNSKLSVVGCSAQLPPLIQIPVEFVPKDEGVITWKETPMFEGPMPEVMNSYLLIDKFNKDSVSETFKRMEIVAAVKSKSVTDLVPSDVRFDDFPKNFLNDHIPPAATFDSAKCIKEDVVRHLSTNHRRKLLVLWGDGGKAANVVFDAGPWDEIVWVFSDDYPNICLNGRAAFLRLSVNFIVYDGPMSEFIMRYRDRFRDFQVLGNYVPEISLFPIEQSVYAVLVCFSEKMKLLKKLLLPAEKRLAVLAVESNFAHDIQAGRKVSFLDPLGKYIYTYDHHSVWKDVISTRTNAMLSLKSVAKEVHSVDYKGNICVLSRSIPETLVYSDEVEEDIQPLVVESVLFVDSDVFSFSSDRLFKVFFDGNFTYGGSSFSFSLTGFVYFSFRGEKLLVFDADVPGSFLQRRDFLRKRLVPLVDCDGGEYKIFVNGPVGLVYVCEPYDLDFSFLDDFETPIYEEEICDDRFFGLAMYEGSIVSSIDIQFYYYPSEPTLATLSAKEVGKNYRLRMGRKKYVRCGKFYFEELTEFVVSRLVTPELITSRYFDLPDVVKRDLLSLFCDV